MRIFSITTLLILFFSIDRLQAQQPFLGLKFNKPIELIFDSTGKMISFPDPVIRNNKTICFQVKVPAAFIYNEIQKFKEKLEATAEFLKVDSIKARYYCYFSKNVDSLNIVDYIASLDSAIKYLDDHSFIIRMMNPAAVNALTGFDKIPLKQFLLNLFQNQFQVQVYGKSGKINSFDLKDMSFNKDSTCFYFSTCKKVKDIACDNCGIKAPRELSVRLFGTNPNLQTVKDWFEIQNTALNNIGVDNMDSAIFNMANAPDVFHDDFENAHGRFKKLHGWMIKWFWFTGGKLVLDPFQTVSDNKVAALKGDVKKLDARLAILKDQKRFIDSVMSKVPFELDSLGKFRKVQDSLKLITDSITKLTAAKANNEKIIAAKTKLEKQPVSFLNNATIEISKAGDIRPQSQLDASDEYNPVAKNKRQFHRVTEIPDNENGFVMVHNVDSAQVIKYDHKRASFADNEEFTEWVSEQLTIIEEASVSSSILGNFQSFFKSFTKQPPVRTGVSPESSLAAEKSRLKNMCASIDNPNAFSSPIYKVVKELAEDYRNGNSTLFYTQSVFDEKEPATPLYRSFAERVKFKPESPFKDSIAVKKVVGDKETDLTTTYVKVGKLRFVQIALGIAINSKPTTITTVDTSAAGFRVTSTDNTAQAIVAFKIYPFQNYNRDRWLIPRYPLRRISVLGGFEMLHPLNNFYLGGCYDVVPGLGVSVGSNFYLKTRYRIENNEVTDTYRNYSSRGPYYSVVVNPVLFVHFVKLFFKAL